MAEKTKIKTSIGGSALIEGIMMRGPKRTTVAIRMSDKSVYTEDIEFKSIASKSKILRLPLIRGFVSLIDSMRLSMKCLMLSADKAVEGSEEEEEPSKFEKWAMDKFGDKFYNIVMGFASFIGVVIAILLFYAVPTTLFNLLAKAAPTLDNGTFWRSAFEGVVSDLFLIAVCDALYRVFENKRLFLIVCRRSEKRVHARRLSCLEPVLSDI